MQNDGERQIGKVWDEIRNDHRSRYVWAEALMPEKASVVDLGSGVGYGAQFMHRKGHQVVGIDYNAQALKQARTHFKAPDYQHADLTQVKATADVAVAFEILEHLKDPRRFLKSIKATDLFVSVPNETYFPYKGPGHEEGYKWHERHYHEHEFRALLEGAGWRIKSMRHQTGPDAAVGHIPGRTLVAHCQRGPAPVGARIAILGLGPSLASYSDLVKRLGGRSARFDEVWGVNALGDVYACDRVFHMDDVRIQARRAEAMPRSNIAVMHTWLKEHPGPVYTSHLEPGYKGLVRYPIERIIHDLGIVYFNSTVAYALALAIHEGAQTIALFGMDFTYPNAHHAEKGRACIEFWIGVARSRGIHCTFPKTSSLMDSCYGDDEALYGFRDGYTFEIGTTNDIVFTPRDEMPTAEEIEQRYDHSVHPNPLVNGED